MHRILVALDSSPRAPAVLTTATGMARAFNAKLHLLRCVGLPPELPANLWSLPPASVTETLVGAAQKEMDAIAAGLPPELVGGAHAQVGVAWDTICSAARELDVDLVVIGSHGYGLLDRLLGTTAAKIVNHVDRSVLVVRG